MYLNLYLDKPSPPRNLEVSAVTAETATMQWEVPEDDGGSSITGYIVEKRDISRKMWQKVDSTEELTMIVPKLLQGNKYLFRVCAQNQYGVSEPVEITEPITAKNPFGKYIFLIMWDLYCSNQISHINLYLSLYYT